MDSLHRQSEPIRMRNYGRIIQDMIEYCCTLNNEREQRSLILYIARCMRQKNLIWNKDQESNWGRIKKDLVTLSKGRLSCDFAEFESLQNQPIPLSGKKKKR
ncbi:MAG: DUF4290 domain-containing protein [Paludibacteraceae bacterium]|nr:DUF4290 domain-containing protein [Paludibacteraceae bacterium]